MLKNFEIIDILNTRSNSVATLDGKNIRFNPQTAEELDYPSHVQFLVYPKKQQFAIRVCKADAANAIEFSKPKAEQKGKKVTVKIAAITNIIRKMKDVPEEENWNIPGVYLVAEKAMVYDLNSMEKPRECKGGWKAKRQKEATEK